MSFPTLYELLSKSGLITQDRLDQAGLSAASSTDSLFDILLEQRFVEERALLEFLSEKLEIPFEIIDQSTIDFKVSQNCPEGFAREHSILPLFEVNRILTVAITNPFNFQVLEELASMTKMVISPVLTLKSSIDSLLGYAYVYQEKNVDEDPSSMANLFEMGMKLIEDKQTSEEEIYDIAQEAPIAKLVDTIIRQAINEKASDIHIEPEETAVKIRFRVDGLLRDVMAPPKKLESPIISRLKILANLDITETRKPQDGRLTFTTKDKDIDFRVSTVRTIAGEKMVMRVLDKSGAFVSLERLGLSDSDLKRLSSLISATSGVVIVCGPTGSGKTSTLYSCLSKINTAEKNIITIEDPVEYNLEGINQIPVNPKIGVDFATGLSAIVRQDPDVIMVGEIRDIETASISIQAALTGHLVFTTLHTRNASGTVTRLVDMGVAPFLLNSSIIGVIAQRLVRTLCPNCRRSVDASIYTGFKQTELIAEIEKFAPKGFKTYKGEGCKFCDNTGYKGRTGIFEIMLPNEEIRHLIIEKASSETIHQAAQRNGMSSMIDDGIQKIISGITSVDEIARVLDV